MRQAWEEIAQRKRDARDASVNEAAVYASDGNAACALPEFGSLTDITSSILDGKLTAEIISLSAIR